MAFPFTPNCKVDIYRKFDREDPISATDNDPDVEGVDGFLRPHMLNGRFGYNQRVFWTNLLYLPLLQLPE